MQQDVWGLLQTLGTHSSLVFNKTFKNDHGDMLPLIMMSSVLGLQFLSNGIYGEDV